METNPGECRARAYDIVMNGYELGGGSIRINDPEIQQRMFAALGFSKESAQERFGFLIDAFKYGAPPHGGMAFGLDRVVMLLLGKDNIRDVIAFPKVQNASELMTGAPGIVEQQSLDDLSLALSVKE
ncbi:MAG: amino acid--tRNA ligase-related protein, partial [Angelakisella sp.]